MRTYKLTLCYDGTDFFGWQRQPHAPTIQGALEDAVAKLAGKKVSVVGAGRTDAGVHARSQVAHFKADLRLGKEDLFRAMNALLPKDIRILSIVSAPPDFHARKSALSKIYEYRIWNSRIINPFVMRFVHHHPFALDLSRMEEAARMFERQDDFSAFSSNRLLNPVRRITRSRIRKKGREIVYTVEANGFLRYMVRTIVGTLLEAGGGKKTPSDIEQAFREKDRSLAGPTAPARGLSLVKVVYGPGFKPMTKASSAGLE